MLTALTESTAKHCMSGSEDSRSLCTIPRKLSTNRLRDCEWHITSRMQNASTTKSTYLAATQQQQQLAFTNQYTEQYTQAHKSLNPAVNIS